MVAAQASGGYRVCAVFLLGCLRGNVDGGDCGRGRTLLGHGWGAGRLCHRCYLRVCGMAMQRMNGGGVCGMAI